MRKEKGQQSLAAEGPIHCCARLSGAEWLEAWLMDNEIGL
jgi:hypothetical protein